MDKWNARVSLTAFVVSIIYTWLCTGVRWNVSILTIFKKGVDVFCMFRSISLVESFFSLFVLCHMSKFTIFHCWFCMSLTCFVLQGYFSLFLCSSIESLTSVRVYVFAECMFVCFCVCVCVYVYMCMCIIVSEYESCVLIIRSLLTLKEQ